MSRVTVVVVTYNSSEVIDACLDSCRPLDVVVVDNASSDETVQKVNAHSSVRLLANSQNRGFAAAVNQGFLASQGAYVLLLNPDVRLDAPPDPLIAALDNDPRCAIAAGVLTNENGAIQYGFTARKFPGAKTLAFEALGLNRVFPRSSVNRKYRCLDRNFTALSEVDQPAGAFLLIRRQAWETLGGFDERFFPVWFEDVDFCKRAREAGYRIVLDPSVRARHEGGHSVNRLSRECREQYWYGSLLKYAAKHLPAHQFRAVAAAVALGAVFRAVLLAAATRSFDPFRIYARVARFGLVCLFAGDVPEFAC